MLLRIARNFESSISVSEKTSCLKKDSALIGQAQTSASKNIVIKVPLNAKYAEGIMSQPFTTRRGQKKTPAKLHLPVLECAKTDPVVPRIILLKVSDKSAPAKETLTYVVLDDQSTDVFITDALQSKLNLSGAEVDLQVNTIVGTNSVRMRRVSGLKIQDINGEYLPVKVPYAYAQPKIPATHSDIATPYIVRQWDHLKDVADEIHYRSDIEIGMLIGRNVPTAFQPLKVIYGEADKPWAEKYKSGWTIIGPVCLDKAKFQECSSVSVSRVTVQREELPDSCIPNVPQASNPLHQHDSVAVLVNKLRSKDVTSPK